MKLFFFFLGISNLFYSQAGNVGINTADSETTLDVHGKNHLGSVSGNDGILTARVSDLAENGTSEGQLVYLMQDWNTYLRGFHYWDAPNSVWKPLSEKPSGEIQLMRFGINGKTAGTSYAYEALNALRFSKYNGYQEFGLTPSHDYNFINSIAGSSFTEDVTLNAFDVPAGELVPPATRTTDLVNLPAGTYEISVRVYCVFNGAGNINSNVRVLLSVNNTYSSKSYSNIGGQVSGTNNSTFLVNLYQPSSIDFLLEPRNPVPGTTVDVIDVSQMPSPDCWPRYIIKSEIIIKKLNTFMPNITIACPT